MHTDRTLTGTTRDEQGFALAAAIFALVIVGALVTGGFFAASQEERIGHSSRTATEAFYLAERGLADVLGTYDRLWYEAIPVGDSAVVGPVNINANGTLGRYAVSVRRLDDRLFFLRSTATSLEGGIYGGGTRSTGLLARTYSFDVPPNRSMQIFGGLSVSGNSEIDGNDEYPANWTGCTSLGTKAGVVAKDSSRVKVSGSARITGTPPVAQDPTLDADDFLKFGDFDFDMLKGLAEKVYPPGANVNNTAPVLTPDGRACDKSVRSNWGAPLDPSHRCHLYFPIIYAQGNLSIQSTASGQGILLVEGDLSIQGGFAFYGIVIVRGSFKTAGTGGHIYGLITVYGNGDLDTQSVSRGNSIVNFSSCAIQRARDNNDRTSRAFPLALRSWIDLSGATGS